MYRTAEHLLFPVYVECMYVPTPSFLRLDTECYYNYLTLKQVVFVLPCSHSRSRRTVLQFSKSILLLFFCKL